MVAQLPGSVRRRTTKPVEIPTLAPCEPRSTRRPSRTAWVQVDEDRYEVRFGPRVIGFVEVVGSVYVALAGTRYDRAVEIAQSLLFDLAVVSLELYGAEDSPRASA